MVLKLPDAAQNLKMTDFQLKNRICPIPDFGRILIGKASKSALRPAFGRPEG
jgi:hypothetical protein